MHREPSKDPAPCLALKAGHAHSRSFLPPPPHPSSAGSSRLTSFVGSRGLCGAEGRSPQLPSLCLSDPRSWDPRQGSRVWRPNSELTPRGRKGRGLNLGTPTTQHLDFSTSASRGCSARNERHLWATGGRCVRFLTKPVAEGIFSCGGGGGWGLGGGGGISIQYSPHLGTSLARSPFPAALFMRTLSIYPPALPANV